MQESTPEQSRCAGGRRGPEAAQETAGSAVTGGADAARPLRRPVDGRRAGQHARRAGRRGPAVDPAAARSKGADQRRIRRRRGSGRRLVRPVEALAGVCRGREWREGEEGELPSPTGGGGSPTSSRRARRRQRDGRP